MITPQQCLAAIKGCVKMQFDMYGNNGRLVFDEAKILGLITQQRQAAPMVEAPQAMEAADHG